MNKLHHTLRVLGLAVTMGLAMPAQASEEQVAAEPWTPEKLRVAIKEMPLGDPRRGSELHNSLMCASCHGDNGIAPTGNWPNVAGQKADYTYKMLLDYRSGLRDEDRRSELMATVVEMMDEQAMADVAAFYATLEPKTASAKAADDAVETLVRQGDPKRLITPCASCHGAKGQGGKQAAASLAGQNPKAFIRTMQLYKSGQRDNDLNDVMSQIARKLTDEEIRLLAVYYQAP